MLIAHNFPLDQQAALEVQSLIGIFEGRKARNTQYLVPTGYLVISLFILNSINGTSSNITSIEGWTREHVDLGF